MSNRRFKAFLLLGVKTDLSMKPIPGGRITFVSLFSKDRPRYDILQFKDKKFDDINRCQGMLEIVAPQNKNLSLLEAMDIGHFYQAIRTIYYFCIIKNYEDYSLLPLNSRILQISPPWFMENLVDICTKEIKDNYMKTEIFKNTFNSYTGEPREGFEHCMPLLARCIDDKNFGLASTYIYRSIIDLGLDVCDWREQGYGRNYDEFASDSARESAFQNACKAMEAICGDFGSKKKTYGNRLGNVGIDPTELCGYKEKEPLFKKVSRYLALRDKLSAHGSGRKRRLKISEIIDFQEAARYIVLNSRSTYKLTKK